MNWSAIGRLLGYLLIALGAVMFVPLLLSLLLRDAAHFSFIVVIAPTMIVGFVISRFGREHVELSFREGFVIVVFSWIVCSCAGAFPYVLSGAVPHYTDAFFEAMSGFTTTGSSVIADVESLPASILLWRSMTQWLGGMGIIVLFIAILPQLGVGALHLFRAEVPGPIKERFVPRLRDNAKIMWYIYLGMTCFAVLALLLSGMSFFDAVNHAFTSVASGGFSTRNASIASFNSPLIEYILCFFMFMAGVNFSLYWLLMTGWWKDVLKDAELRGYFGLAGISTFFIAAMFIMDGKGVELSFRHALFQVISIMTGTGYATADYDLWAHRAGAILLVLMFIGGCAGSTTGGIKVGRIVLLYKQCKRELNRFLHPRAIVSLRMGARSVDQATLISVLQFFFLYMFVLAMGFILISFTGQDFITAFTSTATTLGNVGPGFAAVGPMTNFAETSSFAKWVYSLLMLLGRLELYTVLVLLLPRFWRE